MTEIYLIRHTQAEGNLFRIMQGHWDGNVTDTGRRQVEALAERFKNIKIDALYSSDLFRTRFTASAITKYHDLEMNISENLREINMGVWEARFFGDLCAEDGERIAAFNTDPDSWSVEEGETCAQVADRALGFIKQISEENDGKTIAVVTHGMTIRCCLARMQGIPTSQVPIVRNTAVNHIIYDNGTWNIDYKDDISHLDNLGIKVWQKLPDLHAVYYSPGKDDSFYTDCYADAWNIAHGSLKGFNPSVYQLAAHAHSSASRYSVMEIYENRVPAGLVDLDTERGKENGIGWISFLYLKPDYRHRGNGIQLLARAIMYYRAQGRRALRLNVAEDNLSAISFYKKYGFKIIGQEPGCAGKLLLMEAPLERPRTLL